MPSAPHAKQAYTATHVHTPEHAHIPRYLESDLEVANTLPDVLTGVPVATVENIQGRLRRLVHLVAARDETIRQLG